MSEGIAVRMATFLNERFGDAARVRRYRGQIIVTLNNCPGSKEPETVCKFEQAMMSLRGERSWYSQRDSAKELAYEIVLKELNLPAPVRKRQLIETVRRPVDSSPLEKYTDDEVGYRKVMERREVERRCWDIIEAALEHRHPTGYVRRARRDEAQHSLYRWAPDRFVQTRLEEFDSRVWEKVQRRLDNRRLRFDVIYYLPETADSYATHVFAEIKPASTLAKSALYDRCQQLQCYHAWLLMNGAGNLTPLIVVEPTVYSLAESGIYRRLSADIDREIIPVTVSTPDYIKADVNDRIRISYKVAAYGAKNQIPQNVIEKHEAELDFLKGFGENYLSDLRG